MSEAYKCDMCNHYYDDEGHMTQKFYKLVDKRSHQFEITILVNHLTGSFGIMENFCKNCLLKLMAHAYVELKYDFEEENNGT